ncbi:MAG TPA: hypothetical protein VMD28_00285 [Acidimicrobiales bacterium]|nr:hypothetical protein [Acidimicrobiales bacterium]
MRRVWMSWSSGKDSTAALAALRATTGVEVVRLLVSFNAAADRVAMHAVRRELVYAQAERLGLPVHAVDLPTPCPNEQYESLMASAIVAAVEEGATDVAFGDLFLEDVRAYREQAMAGSGLGTMFPLWRRPTAALARTMVDSGIRAVVTCVDTTQLDRRFAGREFDHVLLDELPSSVDPCGERGEFHTFVYDAPGFARPIDVSVGEVVERDGFVFVDVVGRDAGAPS